MNMPPSPCSPHEPPGPIVLPPPAPPHYRTVMDCEDEISLRWALTEPSEGAKPPSTVGPTSGSCPIDSQDLCDWQIPHLDLTTSRPQDLNEEVKRLMALKEYSILDSEQEEKFERITALASRIFDVPICLVSLVDIGRQWFMSNKGLGDVRETSRQVSFCAHAIQSIDEDVFIVPETHDDPRFKNNSLVTGPPYIRFYAGVPLKAPEGHKLGTFCIIDTKPRPQGLSLSEKQNLRELNEMVLDTMVNRKQEMKRIMDEKTRVIACAAHDLMSPLTGIQLNLGLLMEDESFSKKLDSHETDLIKSSLHCSEIIERICRTAIESFRDDLTSRHKSEVSVEKGYVTIAELVKNVDRVVSMYPKRVPLFINVAEDVPPAIVSDDLKLFRSILNYLTNACKHTETGSIHLRIYRRKAAASDSKEVELGVLPGSLMTPKTDVLVVECEDTGEGVALEKYAALFTPLADVESSETNHNNMDNSGLGLYSVANEIGSLGGNFGVFPREDLNSSSDSKDHDPISGSVFWFTVPLVIPKTRQVSMSPMETEEAASLLLDEMIENSFAATNIDETASFTSKSSVESNRSKRRCQDGTGSPAAKRTASMKRASGMSTDSDYAEESADFAPALTCSMKSVVSDRPKCVLVIDDSVTIRKALSKGFKRLGFHVDEAENGLQGFNLMKAGPYDLVLLDFLMPIMDGIDVAKKMRAWEQTYRPWFRQPIVGLSAHANGKDAELGLKAGMDRFMSKPIPVKTLKDLANSKPVADAGVTLDTRFKVSFDAMELGFSKCADSISMSGINSESSSSEFPASKQSCLIVESKVDNGIHSLQRLVEMNGWNAVVVRTGEDATRLLKMRNWGFVIVDNDLPKYSGVNCIARFRDWENSSRTAKQRNIHIFSSNYTPLSVPSGFDGTLNKPLDPSQIINALERAKH